MTLDELDEILSAKEGEHLEFKEARQSYDFGRLAKYCCALANEGGGRVVLGVTDERPRRVVGSRAFAQPERTRKGLIDRLRLSVDFEEIAHPQGRVLVFSVPPRPLGQAIALDGVRWGREGDALVGLSDEQLRAVFSEAASDFSAEICSTATFEDLDPDAIEALRRRWIAKLGNRGLGNRTQMELLEDAEAIIDGGVTHAALVLFGRQETVRRLLPQAEVIFEYRATEAAGPAQQRVEFRRGFFGFSDELWTLVDRRNDVQHFQDGLFVRDIRTFDERAVREALLNAVTHREYGLAGPVFVRQHERRLTIESPGGFPAGINLANILDRQSPRNRRIADILGRCGLVERSGQGVNLMYEQNIRQGKPLPDFSGTDAHQVNLTLHGTIQHPEFLRYLEKLGEERLASFGTKDLVLLDLVHREAEVPEALRPRLGFLVDQGAVERIGRGRGTRFILSRSLYTYVGAKGIYTRKRGLDRETNKQLILKHIRGNGGTGTRFRELMQVLPSLTRDQIRSLMRSLQGEGEIRVEGDRRTALWYPVAGGNSSS